MTVEMISCSISEAMLACVYKNLFILPRDTMCERFCLKASEEKSFENVDR